MYLNLETVSLNCKTRDSIQENAQIYLNTLRKELHEMEPEIQAHETRKHYFENLRKRNFFKFLQESFFVGFDNVNEMKTTPSHQLKPVIQKLLSKDIYKRE